MRYVSRLVLHLYPIGLPWRNTDCALRRRYTLWVYCLTIVTLCLTNCTRAPEASTDTELPPTMTHTDNQQHQEDPILPAIVELDVFSGQPNPRWSLTAEESTMLDQLVAQLPTGSQQSLPNSLGYRGFIVTVANTVEPLFRVHGSLVIKTKDGVTIYYRDDHSRVEKWLILQGRQHLPADIFELLPPSTHESE